MSITEHIFDDKMFDIIYMTNVVKHLCDANLKSAIAEAHTALKSEGELTIYTLPKVNYKLYGQYLKKYELSQATVYILVDPNK